jgi:PAS domain S-box-containing protein
MCTSAAPDAMLTSATLAGVLFERLLEGVAAHDASGRLVAWNAAAAAITGWPAAVAAERFPVELPDGLHELDAGCWIDARRVQVDDESVTVTLFDDARALRALRASETRWQAAFESSAIGMALLTPAGEFTRVNAALCRMVGYSADELLQRGFADITHPDDLALDRERLARVLDGEPLVPNREKRYLHRDGHVIWVTVGAALAHDAYGEPLLVAQMIDISARKAVEESLLTSAAQLDVKTREQEAFIYTVSHDLRGPLVSIQGFADLLAEDYAPQLDEAGRHYINRMILNVGRMNALLDGLLTLSRIGSVDAERKPVDLGLLWDIVVAQLEPRVAARGADIATVGRLPVVPVNAPRITQVFQNLLENALHFTPLERAPLVRIAASERTDAWDISVTDNGSGVPPDFRRKVFEIFQRLPDSKTLHPDGNGVGLAVVKRVVETHGGEIWVEDAPGGGTAVHFTLPKG